MTLKCLTCLAEGKLAVQHSNGNGQDYSEPLANDAITWAPSWQQQQVGPQMVMACVALPTCAVHLQVDRKSPLDLGKGVILGKAER